MKSFSNVIINTTNLFITLDKLDRLRNKFKMCVCLFVRNSLSLGVHITPLFSSLCALRIALG